FLSSAKPAAKVSPTLRDDELANIDITQALFPSGYKGNSDSFSPTAFTHLLQNADRLLRRLQAAYNDRTAALNELRLEKNVRDEELEEAKTRASLLKMQLQD